LSANGWHLIDPATVTSTPDDYRQFIQGSKLEFGVAKSGYVVSRCQWFSDRSAAYLAAGRPVVAQNTGFTDWLPTGKGLFAFDTADDVVEALRQINLDYQAHRMAARRIAEDFFDSRKVLPDLLHQVGCA